MCFRVGDAYRLYNLDVYGYQIHDKMGIYGSVPYLLAHKQGRTVAVFWLNASETLVEINTEPAVEVSHGMWLHAIVTIPQSVRAPFFNSSIFLWPRALQCNWQMSVGATKCRQIHLEQGPLRFPSHPFPVRPDPDGPGSCQTKGRVSNGCTLDVRERNRWCFSADGAYAFWRLQAVLIPHRYLHEDAGASLIMLCLSYVSALQINLCSTLRGNHKQRPYAF